MGKLIVLPVRGEHAGAPEGADLQLESTRWLIQPICNLDGKNTKSKSFCGFGPATHEWIPNEYHAYEYRRRKSNDLKHQNRRRTVDRSEVSAEWRNLDVCLKVCHAVALGAEQLGPKTTSDNIDIQCTRIKWTSQVARIVTQLFTDARQTCTKKSAGDGGTFCETRVAYSETRLIWYVATITITRFRWEWKKFDYLFTSVENVTWKFIFAI